MPGQIWGFSGCEFDDMRRELRVDGRLVDVEVKPLDVLHQLLLRPGEVVTKGELLDAVWPGTEVVEGSLATAVSKLRKALRPYEDVVVTLPRVGYLLAAESVRRQPVGEAPWPRLALRVGDAVPARLHWVLAERLSGSPSREVWLARNPKTGEQRVFKFALDEPGWQSLKREVALARLIRQAMGDRDDLVRLLEWNFDQHPYFVESEYAGPDLRAWAEAQGGLGAVPAETRMGIFRAVARAVAAVHSLEILHKDLKPGNVMVEGRPGDPGGPRVRLGDLGSASLMTAGELAGLEITDLVLARGEGAAGTSQYSAPEVLAGQAPTRAADVYALGLLLYQLAAGDFRKALAPGWEADIGDARLREAIAHAAAGDPEKRELSVAGLLGRLEAAEVPPVRVESRGRRAAAVGAVALAVAVGAWGVAGGWRPESGLPALPRPLRTVAVLPFEGDGGRFGVALADEVAGLLVQVRGLGVRPVRSSEAADPVRAGTEMKADAVVTGRYHSSAGKLQLSLAAIDVGTGRLLWQDSVQAPAESLIALQVQMALRVRGGLARALGGEAPAGGPEPANEAGYRLFLESSGMASDAGENRTAIGILERAVELDPGFAPAWHALSQRYYMEVRYGRGGAEGLERADQATRRALALDPDSAPAAAGLTIALVERGKVLEAYGRAFEAAQRRPDSVDARFALSYVLRFAGLLRESAEQCETGYLLDPRSSLSRLRSCAVVFLLLGDAPRTMNYLRLDEGSQFEADLLMDLHLRQGRREDALRVAAGRPLQPGSAGELLAACAEDTGSARAGRAAEGVVLSDDPESNYFNGARLAFCGRRGEALRLLTAAVEGGYCGWPALERDPFLAGVRAAPEFAGLRELGRACQERFVRGMNGAGAGRD